MSTTTERTFADSNTPSTDQLTVTAWDGMVEIQAKHDAHDRFGLVDVFLAPHRAREFAAHVIACADVLDPSPDVAEAGEIECWSCGAAVTVPADPRRAPTVSEMFDEIEQALEDLSEVCDVDCVGDGLATRILLERFRAWRK